MPVLITGFPITGDNISTVVRKSLPPDSDWKKVLKVFNIVSSGDASESEIQSISRQFQFKEWWELGMKLIRSCRKQDISSVHDLVKNVVTYNNKGGYLYTVDMYRAKSVWCLLVSTQLKSV